MDVVALSACLGFANNPHQDCESLVNHTDTDEMVLQAHLAEEIHTENAGILR